MKTIEKPLSVVLANLSPEDITFLKDAIALFTDPAQAELLREFRQGEIVLQMDPATGRLHLSGVVENVQTTPIDLIKFVARFNDHEWETICSAAPGIITSARESIPLAEQSARDTLGYLPIPALVHQPSNG